MKPSAALLLATLAFASAGALAQGFPAKPVRIIVPYAAGGAVDVVGRLMAPRMGELLGQPVLVDNRPGAGGNIGADLVAKSAPDGYNVLLTPIGHATSPALYRKLPFDPMDFAGVTQLIATEFVLVSANRVAAGNVREFVAFAKSQPGKLNYGSTGIGAAPHLAFELLKIHAGMDLSHVPYKGDAPLNTALMAGEVEAAIVPISTALPFISSGKLRALGVTGSRRSQALPNVPSVAEGGVPGYEFTSWQGFFVPAKTPRDVIARLHRDSVAAVNTAEIRDKLVGMGGTIVASSPEEFDARYKTDIANFLRVVKEARIPQQD